MKHPSRFVRPGPHRRVERRYLEGSQVAGGWEYHHEVVSSKYIQKNPQIVHSNPGNMIISQYIIYFWEIGYAPKGKKLSLNVTNNSLKNPFPQHSTFHPDDQRVCQVAAIGSQHSRMPLVGSFHGRSNLRLRSRTVG